MLTALTDAEKVVTATEDDSDGHGATPDAPRPPPESRRVLKDVVA